MGAPKSNNYADVRIHAKKVREQLGFSSENIPVGEGRYVAWLDIMGAGHTMSVSVNKSANFLMRLHMACVMVSEKHKFSGAILPINDGVFLVSSDKAETLAVLRDIVAMLALNFIATPAPHDRFLIRGALAFGPVYRGPDVASGIIRKRLRDRPELFERVAFGPPIIQAYNTESAAPPYGVAVHESARTFSAAGQRPLRMTHWLWWQTHDELPTPVGVPSLSSVRGALLEQLGKHFDWMSSSLLFHGLTKEKVEIWRTSVNQYFAMG